MITSIKSYTTSTKSSSLFQLYKWTYITSHMKMIIYLWNFSFGFLQFITFDHFESIHLILKLMPEIFDISIWWTSFWLLGIIHFQYKSFSHFPSQILICAMAFTIQYLFSFGDLHMMSSFSKNNKKCGKIYRHKSTHVSKPTWLLTNHSWQAWRSIYNNHA